jgi:hypothetical protein
MMNICNEEEEQKVSLLALIDKMFIVFFVSSSFQVADADKHFDFFFYSDCLNIEQIDNVHRHAHMYFVVFAIRASSPLNV